MWHWPVPSPLFFFSDLLTGTTSFTQARSKHGGGLLMGLLSTLPPVWQNHHEAQSDPLYTPGCSCAGSQLCPMCWKLLWVFSTWFMPPAHFRHWMTTSYSQIHFMWSIVSGWFSLPCSTQRMISSSWLGGTVLLKVNPSLSFSIKHCFKICGSWP